MALNNSTTATNTTPSTKSNSSKTNPDNRSSPDNISSTDNPSNVIEVDSHIESVCCPPKNEEHWNLHPRVYLKLSSVKSTLCPYCGNVFKVKLR